MTSFFIPGGFGALLLRLDALPDANSPLLPGLGPAQWCAGLWSIYEVFKSHFPKLPTPTKPNRLGGYRKNGDSKTTEEWRIDNDSKTMTSFSRSNGKIFWNTTKNEAQNINYSFQNCRHFQQQVHGYGEITENQIKSWKIAENRHMIEVYSQPEAAGDVISGPGVNSMDTSW